MGKSSAAGSQPCSGTDRRRRLAKVGILDADIYWSPTMLDVENQRLTLPDGIHRAPIMVHGLASIGYLVTDDKAMVVAWPDGQ